MIGGGEAVGLNVRVGGGVDRGDVDVEKCSVGSSAELQVRVNVLPVFDKLRGTSYFSDRR